MGTLIRITFRGLVGELLMRAGRWALRAAARIDPKILAPTTTPCFTNLLARLTERELAVLRRWDELQVHGRASWRLVCWCGKQMRTVEEIYEHKGEMEAYYAAQAGPASAEKT